MKIITLFIFFLLVSCSAEIARAPANKDQCQDDGTGCDFLIIGHRGAPYIEAENTLKSFEESMLRGGNALEIDVNITAMIVSIALMLRFEIKTANSCL